MDFVMIIAVAVMLIMGILMIVCPAKLTRQDMRDDPNAVEQVKKTGYLMIAFSVGAVFLTLKYTLF